MEVRQTETYQKWFSSLKDKSTQYRIDIRIRRVALGNHGDVKALSDGVFELRLDFGPGYRIYFHQKGDELIILLVGGDKSTQTRDIARAKAMMANLEDWTK
jgi:putative addiction module killer protein